jgi:hypothetical protein
MDAGVQSQALAPFLEKRKETVQKIGDYVKHPSWVVERASRVRNIQTRDLCWIFGSGRSGSTWLTELLDGLHMTRTWHEPYFGSILEHGAGLPSEFDRKDYFFSKQCDDAWHEGLRNLFLSCARARFGRISKVTKIIVKDISAPQICPHFASVFPDSKFLLLVRDPYDVLDSFIDMTAPGSWNKNITAEHTPTLCAEHIKRTMEFALGGYRTVRDDLRMMIGYRDLVRDPVEQILRCEKFLGIPISEKEVEETVQAHRFDSHEERGKLAFRRFGRPGIWKESGNFTPEVFEVAQKFLGPLRCELGFEPYML